MTTNALEALRTKRRNGEPMTKLENGILDAFYTQDPHAFEMAEELAAKDRRIASLEKKLNEKAEEARREWIRAEKAEAAQEGGR